MSKKNSLILSLFYFGIVFVVSFFFVVTPVTAKTTTTRKPIREFSQNENTMEVVTVEFETTNNNNNNNNNNNKNSTTTVNLQHRQLLSNQQQQQKTNVPPLHNWYKIEIDVGEKKDSNNNNNNKDNNNNNNLLLLSSFLKEKKFSSTSNLLEFFDIPFHSLLSSTMPSESPLHVVIVFNSNNNNNNEKENIDNNNNNNNKFVFSLFLHPFYDPRYVRLHDGHHPTEKEMEKERYEYYSSKSKKRKKNQKKSVVGSGGELLKKPPTTIRNNSKAQHSHSHHHHHHHDHSHHHPDKLLVNKREIERFWIPSQQQQLYFLISEPTTKNNNNNSSQTNHHHHFSIQTISLGDNNNNNQHQQQQKQPELFSKSTNEIRNEREKRRNFLQQQQQKINNNIKKTSSSRKASTLETSSTTQQQPELFRIAETGPPTTQLNLVFLSAGYLQSQRDMYIQNITDVVNVLRDPQMDLTQHEPDTSDAVHDIHRTSPLSRYFSFLNIYSVFEPSTQVGASRPLIGLTVDNNLGCLHPAEIERAVSCDRELALALAAVSPAPITSDPERVIIVTIVNTHIYGGSAIYIPGKMRFASFFNSFSMSETYDRERMLSLVTHEIAHSLGNLMDEYSVGVREPGGRYLRNCQADVDGAPPRNTDLQWNDWVQAKNTAGGSTNFLTQFGNGIRAEGTSGWWGVLDVPQSICGFTNYYKSNTNCMMNRLNDFALCSVCRDQYTSSMLEIGFELGWPRFPFQDQVLLVRSLDSIPPSTTTAAASPTTTSSSTTTTMSQTSTTSNDTATSTTTIASTTSTSGAATTTQAPTTSSPTTATTSSPSSSSSLPALNTSSTIVLHLNRELTTANGFTVTAFDSDDAPLTIISTTACPCCIQLGPTNFNKYQLNRETKIRVEIVDSTNNFLLQSKRTSATLNPNYRSQVSQTAYFRIAVVTEDPATQIPGVSLYNHSLRELRLSKNSAGIHESDEIPRYTFCLHSNISYENRNSETEAQKNATFCNFSLSSGKVYQKPDAAGALIVSFQNWIPVVCGGLAIMFLVLWGWAANKFSEDADGKPRLIFKTEFSTCLKLIRYTMQGAAVIVLIIAVAAIAVSLYMYYNTSVLGKLLVVIGIIVSVLLYLLAFIGFWSVTSRSRYMLILNLFCLAVPLGGLIYILVQLSDLGNELKLSTGFVADGLFLDPDTSGTGGGSNITTTPAPPASADNVGFYMKQLQQWWEDLVRDSPDWACSLESMLECSGWYLNCQGTLSSSLHCPPTCAATNEKYFTPCQKITQNFITTHYAKALLGCFVCVAVLGCAFLLNITNLILLWQHKKELAELQKTKLEKIEKQLKAKQKYQGAAAGGTHQHQQKGSQETATTTTKTKTNRCLFLLRSLEKDLRLILIRELKRIAVTKKSTHLTKSELTSFCGSALGYKPTRDEIDDIFAVGDLDGNGLLSLREFLIVFGWSVEEFKSVKAPPPPEGLLSKGFASFRKRSSVSSPSQQQQQQEEAMLTDLHDDHEMTPSAAVVTISPTSTTMKPDEIAEKRHEMRRRASLRLGFDILAVGESPTVSPSTTSLTPQNNITNNNLSAFSAAAAAATTNHNTMNTHKAPLAASPQHKILRGSNNNNNVMLQQQAKQQQQQQQVRKNAPPPPAPSKTNIVTSNTNKNINASSSSPLVKFKTAGHNVQRQLQVQKQIEQSRKQKEKQGILVAPVLKMSRSDLKRRGSTSTSMMSSSRTSSPSYSSSPNLIQQHQQQQQQQNTNNNNLHQESFNPLVSLKPILGSSASASSSKANSPNFARRSSNQPSPNRFLNSSTTNNPNNNAMSFSDIPYVEASHSSMSRTMDTNNSGSSSFKNSSLNLMSPKNNNNNNITNATATAAAATSSKKQQISGQQQKEEEPSQYSDLSACDIADL